MAEKGVKVTFGGKPVYQPGQLLEFMEYREFARVDRFERQQLAGQCNRFLNPLGMHHATGYLLMLKKDVDAISDEITNSLIIEQAPGLPTLTFKKLIITHCTACFNAKEADDIMYVVEVADRRWFGSGKYWDVEFEDNSQEMFNLPAEMYPEEYHADSTDGGTPWTWQQVITELWPTWLSPTAPTLPFTPDGDPVGFDFRGGGPYEALGIILKRLGCALRYIPSTGEYGIVQLGESYALEAAEDYKVENFKKYLEDQLHYIDPTIALYPVGTVVKFHKMSNQPGSENTFPMVTGQWSTDSIHSVRTDATEDDIGDEGAVMDGVYADLWDDLPAWTDFDGTTITNTTEINARAAERHEQFYKRLHDADTIYRRAYAVGLNFETSGKCRGVAWYQGNEEEWVTETRCHPRMTLDVKDGKFVEIGSSIRNRPPLLTPTYPTSYPYETAFVRIEGVASGGVYPVTEVRQDGSDLSTTDGIEAGAVNAN